MVYVRGHDRDYDAWNKSWGPDGGGWGAADVLPYFKKMEGVCSNTIKGDAADILPGRRGTEGPLQVSQGVNALETPLYDAFIKAGAEAGYGANDDYNGCRQEGLSKMPMSVFHSGPHKGERASTRQAYLEPAIADHPSLTVQTDAHTRRILWDDSKEGESPRAIGVEFAMSDGSLGVVHANKEVILSAGAIASPMLLQLSGVGPPELLEDLGIPLVRSMPGVGANLQDHLEVYQSYEVLKPVSLVPHVSLVGKGTLGAYWLCTKKGLGATNHFEAGGFVRSRAGVEHPDIQLHFLPIGMSYDGVTLAKSSTGHSMQLHVGYNRSPSRGHVKATSALTEDLTPIVPTVRFNYMSTEEDWKGFRTAVRITREIMAQPAMKELCGPEISPGAQAQTDAEIDEFLIEHLESAYHPSGTCKMGPSSDPTAVVGADGKVHGIQGLRVVDASVFPTIPNGNLNSPTIMTAEKMADHILGKGMLPPDVEQAKATWIASEWETKQRENEPLVKAWDGVF
jgi:choline dehydrogenase